MAVTVRSYPRLHFSLIDLGETGYRKFGGVGMSINALPIELTFEKSVAMDLAVLGPAGYTSAEVSAFTEHLSNLCQALHLTSAMRLCSAIGIKRHIGLGSGTRVSLSLVEALFLLNGVATDEEAIKAHSGRGGASGVGVDCYFRGRLSVDIGRPRASASGFVSSDEAQHGSFAMPLTIASVEVPKWSIALVNPAVMPITMEQEAEYFRTGTPVSAAAVHEAAYATCFGVLGGAASGDIEIFARAVQRLRELPWKNGEISLYGDQVRSRIRCLEALGPSVVTMSSMGPTIACIGPDTWSLDRSSYLFSQDAVILTTGRNIGREVEYG